MRCVRINACLPIRLACSERLLVEYENALVLVTDMKIENVKDIIPLLEQVGWGGSMDVLYLVLPCHLSACEVVGTT